MEITEDTLFTNKFFDSHSFITIISNLHAQHLITLSVQLAKSVKSKNLLLRDVLPPILPSQVELAAGLIATVPLDTTQAKNVN